MFFRKRQAPLQPVHTPANVPSSPVTSAPEADAKAELRRQMYERIARKNGVSDAEELADRKFSGK